MLRVGLTGGIGSGKSTAAKRLAARGAVVVDADQLAREVVEPGSAGLAAVVERFGADVLAADGSLDRPALGALVFHDEEARRDLEGITHPRIAQLTRARIAQAPPEAVVVHDVPLLVEKSMGSAYHLVLVVDTDEPTRLDRLVRSRDMDESDARRRIAAQATDPQRRAAADVLLGNGGSAEDLEAAIDELWARRLVPYEANVRGGIRAPRSDRLVLSDPDPRWADTGRRLAARVSHALGDRLMRVDHVGSTAVPGLLAKDVIDLQVGVRSLADADDPEFLEALARAGFPRVAGTDHDNPKGGELTWPKRFHGSCDPGRVAHVHIREMGSPGWIWALRFRDWMRADEAARSEYAAVKVRIAGEVERADDYTAAKEPWFDSIHDRVGEWVEHTDWVPRS